ncbi:unnamed protein product [Gongylonema pulchrum]|uniref:Store-operated calcium entry-associated regulatory factor n=1 Tax=Gongylonema pulchrum TaxID=637853 RepID=A0A183DYT9_9BILA|nr:unnamed protein product [Gongylonema pulchrum]
MMLHFFIGCTNKVRLTDVTTLTLHQGQYTTGRRSPSIPQIQCVVQCYNRGFDGLDVQWECKAEMSDEYEFGKVTGIHCQI